MLARGLEDKTPGTARRDDDVTLARTVLEETRSACPEQ